MPNAAVIRLDNCTRRIARGESTMLIRDHVVFVFRIDWLVVRGNVDIIVWEFIATEVFKEVGETTGGKVNVSSSGIF